MTYSRLSLSLGVPLTALVALVAFGPPQRHAVADIEPPPSDTGAPYGSTPTLWTGTLLSGAGNLDDGAYASMVRRPHSCLYYPCPTVYISHHRMGSGELVYTKTDDYGGAPSTVVVDSGSGDDIVGTHTSIDANADGTAFFISYRNETDQDLKLAHKVPSNSGNCTNDDWECRTISSGGLYTSIDYDDSNQRVNIAHASASALKYSYGAPPYAPANFTTKIVANKSITSAAVAVDFIHYAHFAFTDARCVYYRRWLVNLPDDQQEAPQTVECAPEGSPTLAAGSASIKVNASRLPHIAYMMANASGTYRIKHAYKESDPDATTWAREVVSSYLTAAPRPGTSILLDADGDATAISWGTTVDGAGRLSIAQWGKLQAFLLPSWIVRGTATPGGSFGSLAVAGSGKLIASHYDPLGGDLRFSRAP